MLETRKGQRHLIEAIELLRGDGANAAADVPTENLRCFIAGTGALAGRYSIGNCRAATR